MTVEGYKHFIDAQSMSAFDVNAFLMSQAVTRFDTAADREAALEQVVTEGMVSYNKDTGELQLYDGSAWQTVAIGAIGAAGSDGQVQYNNGGSFAGSSSFTFDSTSGKVTTNILQLASGPDVNGSGGGSLRLGNYGSQSSMALDNNEIQAFSATGSPSTLNLNIVGGNVVLGTSSSPGSHTANGDFAATGNVTVASTMTATTATATTMNATSVLNTNYIRNTNGNFLALEGGDSWNLGTNASGEHVWLAAEGGIFIVSSDANSTNWANRNQVRIDPSGGIDENLVVYAKELRMNNVGGANAKIGRWQANDNYAMFGTDDMTGAEYSVISGGGGDGNTYISAKSGASVIIRGSANSSTNQATFSTGGTTLGTTTFTGTITGDGSGITSLNASNISSGTFPDRFSSSTRYNIGYIDGVSGSDYDKLRVYNSSSYSIGMVSGITYGHLGDWAMTFRMNSNSNRGFWWGDTSHTSSTGAMSLTTNGRLTVARSLSVGQGESITSPSTSAVYIDGSINMTGGIDASSGNGFFDNLYVNYADVSGVVEANEFRATDSGPANDAAFTFSGDEDSGLYRIGANQVALSAGGVTRLRTDSTYGVRIDGAGGYLQIGPANTSYCHLQTDRSQFYFNKKIVVDSGIISTYNEDMYLQRAGSSAIRLASSIAYHYYESKFQYESTSNDWSAQPVQEISSQDCGYATRSYNSDTHTGQWRAASGTWYSRSHNDGSYWTVAAVISNQSSYRMKQDIETWGHMKPLSSAVNADYDTTAIDLVRQLRPVSYRFNKQDRLPRDLPSERRQDALDKLNRIKLKQGEKQFDSEEVIHECGRDCDQSVDDPCVMYRQWERGTIGFIAEEVGEIIPEVTDMDVRPRSTTLGQNTAIDALALTAVLTKAIQEIDARLSALESAA